MRLPVLLRGVELRRGQAGLGQKEVRVVAETAVAARYIDDLAVYEL